MISRWVISLSIIIMTACFGLAQNATRIDGRRHPELIPDTAAFRAVLLLHSHFEMPEVAQRSEQFHAKVSLNAADHTTYDQVLRKFRQEYESLLRAHESFIDANISSASITDLQEEANDTRQALSGLVEATRAQLATRLSANGFAKLDDFVQTEKTHMVVGVRGAQ